MGREDGGQDIAAASESQMMWDKLRGDTFPGGGGLFLTEDIGVFFAELFERTGQKKSEVIRRANIDRTYGFQIFNGTRIAKRDYYLRIALAMGLDLRTTQRMLAVAKCGCLHSLPKRDAAVIFAINHGYSNEAAYDFLCELGLDPLEKDA